MHILDWSEHEPPQRRLSPDDARAEGPLPLRLRLPVCPVEEDLIPLQAREDACPDEGAS